ncbi:hypothetical protein [Microbulbifer thermotolerans]|uniref:Uncharacterized protein n=1 Tax=Microbulbifer thermotolerans TaxID=252514 RepID=A0A143HIX8_MICTH|nr:hypothetical protein [Microbulbifer thermotolerans]AMX01668.1 hypothetical protein A3224_02915 [Microbulbifer thermotolerans]MCX2779434.1 hypothetical protein [Microbulbifer thermotolerans]MCX2784054.1 hypothetical protein [Microbulbifer thermotolerans]MCX2793305.1 hypothetical protein [Microbulbifer thermotolerans]MCX2801243.1 hypothetical protein [Microbulbifer thermotolerans]
MTILLTLLLSICIFALIIWALMHMRTPRFRMERKDFLKGLEDVITGQADDNEWRVLTGYPMRHDPDLEQLRLECLKIEEAEYTGGSPYLFTRAGLEQLREVRRKLLAAEKESD